jgi:hypothetical protein
MQRGHERVIPMAASSTSHIADNSLNIMRNDRPFCQQEFRNPDPEAVSLAFGIPSLPNSIRKRTGIRIRDLK